MRPLSLDDLLPLTEYVNRRHEFFVSLSHYIDRYRRVRIGPQISLLFANRQTLWFQVQELIRIARLSEPARVQQELNLYNRLLPGRDVLQAALLIEIADPTHMSQELEAWQTLAGEEVNLHLGECRVPSKLLTCRPEDRCIGAAHWVHFDLPNDARPRLADFSQPAFISVRHGDYCHESPPLGDDVRQSLLDDLELSDRDAE